MDMCRWAGNQVGETVEMTLVIGWHVECQVREDRSPRGQVCMWWTGGMCTRGWTNPSTADNQPPSLYTVNRSLSGALAWGHLEHARSDAEEHPQTSVCQHETLGVMAGGGEGAGLASWAHGVLLHYNTVEMVLIGQVHPPTVWSHSL